jgi:flagellin
MPYNGVNSINFNAGALVALGNFNSTSNDLQVTYDAVSTGKLINGPKTSPAVWAVAQRSASDSKSLGAVIQSLQRNQSVNEVAVSAGQTIVDLLTQLKSVVASAADPSTDASSRASYLNQFKNLVRQINNTASTASFNGVNLVRSGATSTLAMANADGSLKITVLAQDLSVGTGAIRADGVTFTTGYNFSTATQAQALMSLVNTSLSNVTSRVGQLGNNATMLANQLNMIQLLQQGLDGGVSNLVDADMAKESALLQALQAKQQLGIQALAIANSSKTQLLSLFK